MANPRRLNLGCGPYKERGFINIDRNPLLEPDLVRDVLRGLPYDDGSVVEVRAWHFLEHVPREELPWLIGEIWRVLGIGGLFHIRVPLREPYSLDHLQSFDEWSFDPLVLPETAAYYQQTFIWEDLKREVVPPHKGGVAQIPQLDVKLTAVKLCPSSPTS